MSARQPESIRPPKRVFIQEPTNFSTTTTPYVAAKTTFALGCSALQFLNKDQSNKLASRFSELIKQVHSKLRVRDKFAQEGFVPKPLLFKPVLNACSKVKETSNFKALIEQEADIITRFKTDMSRLMFETAELELANAANDALTFSVGFTKKLVLYQRTVSNMDGSGDPSLIEQVVRELFYE